MYQHTRLTQNNFNFFQKFKNFDYILLVCILFLGFISLATMYSTDGGKILFHTKSHFIKLIVFTSMMLIFSFINIKFWFTIGYLSYVLTIGLLFWTYLFGITSSPTVVNDLFIDRGRNAVIQSHMQLGEIKNMTDLINYGNGFYNL